MNPQASPSPTRAKWLKRQVKLHRQSGRGALESAVEQAFKDLVTASRAIELLQTQTLIEEYDTSDTKSTRPLLSKPISYALYFLLGYLCSVALQQAMTAFAAN